MTDPNDALVFTVTDLKQYTYCPRIVYYTYCLPLLRPTTFKMESGIAAHERGEMLERRRTLSAYGLDQGTRHFGVDLSSPALGLRGRADLLIECALDRESEWIPVDYKQSRRKVGRHIKLQLAAYGMMAADAMCGVARRGFVYSLLTRRATEVPLTPRLCSAVRKTVTEMRESIEGERMPDVPRSHRACVSCEFRRFCNDVL
jgi:CRISPR-associated exonuclease Cas4